MLRESKYITVALLLIALNGARLLAQAQVDSQLLHVREAVWRAWFADDTKTLKALVPPDTIVISGGETMGGSTWATSTCSAA
jgi:hypothetical protein